MKPNPLRIGIVDYHGDFRRMITDIVPLHHTVVSVPVDAPSVDVDLLINHHDASRNGRHHVPFIALPYGTVTSHHVEHWNAKPNCVGVIDVSGDILRRFPWSRPPTLSFIPFHPSMPLFERAGEKTITLIERYKERFPDGYRLARTLASNIYGDPFVPDVVALQDAKWLLHLKPSGAFVCNAVVKALACGVPVVMDNQTWENGYFNNLVFHNHNGVVLRPEELGEFLRSCSPQRYSRIKQICLSEANLYRRTFKWTDGWWDTKVTDQKLPSEKAASSPQHG